LSPGRSAGKLAGVHPSLVPLDRPAPPPDSAGFGALRVRVLEAWVLGRRAEVPAGALAGLDAWAGGLLADTGGPARGLTAAAVPAPWFDLLSWAGVPMAAAGDLQWGGDLLEDPALAVPEFRGDRLALPPLAVLARLTSLALRPLRLHVARRLGVRLQAATGLHLWLWPRQALLVSQAEVPLGGFLYGPGPGQRHGVAVDPGGFQVMHW
jgi:hypothetical protein